MKLYFYYIDWNKQRDFIFETDIKKMIKIKKQLQ